MHEKVQYYWQDLKGPRLYPTRQEIEPIVIKDAWDWCFIADVQKLTEHGFRYEYVGPELTEIYGAHLTHTDRFSRKTGPDIDMAEYFSEITESGEPLVYTSEFNTLKQATIKYRCCLLPLGRDRVEYILGCMRWKAV